MGERDDFTRATKRKLASRVAYRCSFPGCDTATIGPGAASEEAVIVLGEAAHITAAAERGPRYDRTLTREERRGIGNGIWMCPHHAGLVDKDELNYSAATLRDWKKAAESRAADALRRLGLSQPPIPVPTTLIAFGFEVVAQGVWAYGERDRWRFKIKSFVRGDAERLRRFVEEAEGQPERERFIVVASQGDGREVAGRMSWERGNDGVLEITVPIWPRPAKRPPAALGADLAWSPDGDFVVEGGRLKFVSGLDNALQRLRTVLNTPLGSWRLHPAYGSLWARYHREHGDDPRLLEALFKLDLARLATVPQRDALTRQVYPEHQPSAPLNFIERVQRVRVLEEHPTEAGDLLVALDLDLANGEPWSGEVRVRVLPA